MRYDDGRWVDYGNAYVVLRPIVEENYSDGTIKIVNPARNGANLNYMLNGNVFSIPPGCSQDIREDRTWVIRFSQGATLDEVQYWLPSGVYTFACTDHGWDLFRSELPRTVASQPPMAVPMNPLSHRMGHMGGVWARLPSTDECHQSEPEPEDKPWILPPLSPIP